MHITSERIKLDRELSELDKFAINFSKTISKHTEYVIVSGYVSILLGRSRASEDIDMLISEMSEEGWIKIYNDLESAGYYCLNADARESFSYLKDNIAARFAPKGRAIPNMEILFAINKIQKLALATRIKAHVGSEVIDISNLELQIAYKEKALGSPKDMEDAAHLRELLDKAINKKKLREYEGMLDE